jgi:hypothetical protein
MAIWVPHGSPVRRVLEPGLWGQRLHGGYRWGRLRSIKASAWRRRTEENCPETAISLRKVTMLLGEPAHMALTELDPDLVRCPAAAHELEIGAEIETAERGPDPRIDHPASPAPTATAIAINPKASRIGSNSARTPPSTAPIGWPP